MQPGLSASANSRTDTAYYSPARTSPPPRRWPSITRFTSAMTPSGASSYWPAAAATGKNHAAGAITVLGYGQRLRWNNVVDTGLMLNWDKRPYDGKRENNLAITLDANIRF